MSSAATSTHLRPCPPTLRRLGRATALALPVAVALLQGCASVPSASEPSAARPAVAAGEKVSPKAQADLDAAMALAQAKQYDQSIEALNKLAAQLPDNPIPQINLALVYKTLDKPELAEESLKKALAIEPDNPVASNELALLYRKAGRFAEARPVYEKVLTRYPNFAMAHKNLGVLCDLYLRDYECALTHYKVYSQSAPDDKSVKIWIADLQKRTGK